MQPLLRQGRARGGAGRAGPQLVGVGIESEFTRDWGSGSLNDPNLSLSLFCLKTLRGLLPIEGEAHPLPSPAERCSLPTGTFSALTSALPAILAEAGLPLRSI